MSPAERPEPERATVASVAATIDALREAADTAWDVEPRPDGALVTFDVAASGARHGVVPAFEVFLDRAARTFTVTRRLQRIEWSDADGAPTPTTQWVPVLGPQPVVDPAFGADVHGRMVAVLRENGWDEEEIEGRGSGLSVLVWIGGGLLLLGVVSVLAVYLAG